MSARFLLAQISDMHVCAGAREDGADPSANLSRALEAIAAMRVDAIIATGDLVNDAKDEEYVELARLLADAPAPHFLVPGNHDDSAQLRRHFPAAHFGAQDMSYVVDDFPIRLVALDDTLAGEVHGAFTPARAAWLEAALSAAPSAPTIIALHHPPFAVHDRLLDTIALKQSDAFAEMVARHPQVLRIICGHNHRAGIGQVAHAPAFIAPSTAWSFSLALHPDQKVAERSQIGIGWALHAWTREAGLASHVMNF
jgi:3',5'-cyclic AMP phosphodiesterase CpdA